MAPAEAGDREVERWQEWLTRPSHAEGSFDVAPGHTHAETLRLIDGRLTEMLEEIDDVVRPIVRGARIPSARLPQEKPCPPRGSAEALLRGLMVLTGLHRRRVECPRAA